MAMHLTENIRDFFSRLNKVNRIILDVYQGYTLIPQDPVPDANGNITMTLAEHQAYKKALVENVVEFYILNQFWAALLPDLRGVINLHTMHTLDMDTAVGLARIELRLKHEAKGASKIQAVQQEEEDYNVDAVMQNRRKKTTPSLSKIEVSKDTKISDHKTTVTKIISNNGGTITPATTLTATR
jgi:hypothetical protein